MEKNVNDYYWQYYRNLPESMQQSTIPLKLERAGCTDGKEIHRNYNRKKYPFAVFEAVIDGGGFVTVNGSSFAASSGDIYYLPQNADSLLEYSRTSKVWIKKYFLVSGTLTENLMNIFGLTGICHFPGTAAQNIFLFDEILELYRKQFPGRNARTAELLMRLVWNLRFPEDESTRCSLILSRTMQIIDQCFSGKLDLDRIANSLAISRSSLQQHFKKELGITPYEYHLQRKFTKAKELLRNTKLPIQEIAKQLAFHDMFHFSTSFRKRFGISPSEFRKNGK